MIARLLPLLAGLLLLALPIAAGAATKIDATGTATSGAPVITPISTRGNVFIFDVSFTATFTGTFSGTSTAQNRCMEQLDTGQAHCTGPELFTGKVAGQAGTVQFFDTYFLNLNTAAVQGLNTAAVQGLNTAAVQGHSVTSNRTTGRA